MDISIILRVPLYRVIKLVWTPLFWRTALGLIFFFFCFVRLLACGDQSIVFTPSHPLIDWQISGHYNEKTYEIWSMANPVGTLILPGSQNTNMQVENRLIDNNDLHCFFSLGFKKMMLSSQKWEYKVLCTEFIPSLYSTVSLISLCMHVQICCHFLASNVRCPKSRTEL